MRAAYRRRHRCDEHVSVKVAGTASVATHIVGSIKPRVGTLTVGERLLGTVMVFPQMCNQEK